MKGSAEILKEALALPTQARAALAESIIDSLDQQTDENAELEWLAEIDRRIKEIDNGSVEMIPWEEAKRRLWTKLSPK